MKRVVVWQNLKISAAQRAKEVSNLTRKRKNGLLESQRIGQTVHLSEKLLRERRRRKPRANGMNG